MERRSPFISKATIPVPEWDGVMYDDDGSDQPLRPDVIFIRAALPSSLRDELKNAIIVTNRDMSEVRINASQNYLLLKAFVVKWEGPSYDGVPLTDAALNDLDTDNPHIQKVLDRIGTIQLAAKVGEASPDPNAAGSTGSGPRGKPASVAPVTSLWERGTPTSSSVNSTPAGASEILTTSIPASATRPLREP